MPEQVTAGSIINKWTQKPSEDPANFDTWTFSTNALGFDRSSHSPLMLNHTTSGRATLSQRNHQLMRAFGDQPHRLLGPQVLHNSKQFGTILCLVLT